MLRRLVLAALILGAVPVSGTISTAASAEECSPAFANFIPRIVRKSAIQAVDESYDVHLYGFCPKLEFHDSGNAGGLTRTMAANPYIVGPIEDLGWSVEDVKYVRVGDNSIDLWLHRDP